jgi:hypothetical protein
MSLDPDGLHPEGKILCLSGNFREAVLQVTRQEIRLANEKCNSFVTVNGNKRAGCVTLSCH